jgi:hypothetical protein
MSGPTDQNGSAVASLSAVHVCQNCGSGTKRLHLPLVSVINGPVRCRACGHRHP